MLAGILAGPVLFSTLAWGYTETRSLCVTHTQFIDESLPSSFDSYRLALIGGLHLKKIGTFEKRIQHILAENSPDILLVAGNIKPSHGADNQFVHGLLNEFLAPLQFPDGILAVRGYHDRKHFWDQIPEGAGYRLLSNSHFAIQRRQDCLAFVGIQSPHASHLDRGQNQLRESLRNCPPASYRIWLGQSPDMLRIAQGFPLNLIVAVDNLHHQVRIPGYGVLRRDSKVPAAWQYSWLQEGHLFLYLSPGAGTRGIPLRFFMRPEVAFIDLKKTAPQQQVPR